MKKNGILNADISRVLTYMGHTDRIAIGDCGLPIPGMTERIDLALRFGVPSFMEVLETVCNDMAVEKIILAEEIKKENPEVHCQILSYFEKADRPCDAEYVSHAELKKMTEGCKAVIRSGETTPYANIILQSACIFG